VYLDPFGFVLIDGFDRYRMFYKDALDKLSIDMHLFRAGKFKSADEPLHTARHVARRPRGERGVPAGAVARLSLNPWPMRAT
jgi:hypothetical protein